MTTTMTTSMSEPVTTTDWKKALPALAGTGVTLRELRLSDASSLCDL
jgi:hypothetical protein